VKNKVKKCIDCGKIICFKATRCRRCANAIGKIDKKPSKVHPIKALRDYWATHKKSPEHIAKIKLASKKRRRRN